MKNGASFSNLFKNNSIGTFHRSLEYMSMSELYLRIAPSDIWSCVVVRVYVRVRFVSIK